MPTFLQQLRVDWPAVSENTTTEALRNRTIAELSPARDAGALPSDTLGRVCLKELMEERGRTAGYDPNVDSCLGRPGILAGRNRDGAPPPAHSPASLRRVFSSQCRRTCSLCWPSCRRLCRLRPRTAP